MKTICLLLTAALGWITLSGCHRLPAEARPIDAAPAVFPDYREVTVPVNIAPLNFRLETPGECRVLFSGANCRFVASGKDYIDIPLKPWKRLLRDSRGKQVEVTVYQQKDGEWLKFRPFHFNISPDSVDNYLAYRLIEPTYANWNKIGIYQRDLSSFSEKEIIANDKTGHNCMNCHAFNRQDPDQLVMHTRKTNPGTLLIKDGKPLKLDTRTDFTISNFVYPYWHPAGNDIAFSTNNTQMSFYEAHDKIIEVYDLLSDIVVYNLPRNEVYTSPLLSSPDRLENFPVFSPDGKTLYFCTCPRVDSLPQTNRQVKYRLCSIGFDAERRQFASKIDTLIDLTPAGKGVSLPSVSPDGRYLVCSVAASGCFLSWDKTSDLYLFDTRTRALRPLDALNTDNSESYTSWSSNGKWLVFSSRRLDGVYNRPFLAHIDSAGNVGKPFLLPQRNPGFYQFMSKAFNLPQFIRRPVTVSPHRIASAITDTAAVRVTFRREGHLPKRSGHAGGEVN